jgi:ABC-type transport system substrate-binding protein
MTMRLRVFVLAALLAASSAGCGGQEPEAASTVASNQPSTDAGTEPGAQTERVTITFDPAAYTTRTEAEVMECFGLPGATYTGQRQSLPPIMGGTLTTDDAESQAFRDCIGAVRGARLA